MMSRQAFPWYHPLMPALQDKPRGPIAFVFDLWRREPVLLALLIVLALVGAAVQTLFLIDVFYWSKIS
jgi:hypothetical protein